MSWSCTSVDPALLTTVSAGPLVKVALAGIVMHSQN